MNGADADRPAQHVTHELENAEIRTTAHQRQRDDHLAQPSLGDRYLEQHRIVRGGGDESVIQSATRLVLLRVDEFTAHPVLECGRAVVYQLAFTRARSSCRPDSCLTWINFFLGRSAITDRDPAAMVVVPPRATAAPGETAETEPAQRDHHFKCIAEKGRIGWQKMSGYNNRSRVEATIGRYK